MAALSWRLSLISLVVLPPAIYLTRRVAQMRELNVFRDSLAEVHAENRRGLAALDPWTGLNAVHPLQELARVLEAHANALQTG